MTMPNNIAQSLKQQERELLEAGARLGRFDKIRQREFYSSYLFAPGQGGDVTANTYELFNAVEGDLAQGYNNALTKLETNWPSKGRISNNQNLVIKSLHVDIRRAPTDPRVFASTGGIDFNVPIHPTDVETIMRSMVLGIKYLTNNVPQGLISEFPSVGGVHGFMQSGRQSPALVAGVDQSPDLAAQGVQAYGNLAISRNATQAAFERRAKVPTLLQHGEQFTMTLDVPKAFTLLGANTAAQGDARVRDTTGCFVIRVSFWATESFVEKS